MGITEILSGYLTDNVAIDQMTAATAAGVTTITSSALDCSYYDGVLIIAIFGTAATNNTLTVSSGATSGGSFANTTGTVACTASNGILLLDLKGIAKQFIKTVMARGTSTTIDQVLAIRYMGRSKAVTQATTEVLAQFNAP